MLEQPEAQKVPHLLMQRWLFLLGEDETIATLQSSQFGVIVVWDIERGSKGTLLIRSSEQCQTIEARAIGRVGTGMQQVAFHHLVDDLSFAIQTLRNQREVQALQIQPCGNFNG